MSHLIFMCSLRVQHGWPIHCWFNPLVFVKVLHEMYRTRTYTGQKYGWCVCHVHTGGKRLGRHLTLSNQESPNYLVQLLHFFLNVMSIGQTCSFVSFVKCYFLRTSQLSAPVESGSFPSVHKIQKSLRGLILASPKVERFYSNTKIMVFIKDNTVQSRVFFTCRLTFLAAVGWHQRFVPWTGNLVLEDDEGLWIWQHCFYCVALQCSRVHYKVFLFSTLAHRAVKKNYFVYSTVH